MVTQRPDGARCDHPAGCFVEEDGLLFCRWCEEVAVAEALSELAELEAGREPNGPWSVRRDDHGYPAALCRNGEDVVHLVGSERTGERVDEVVAALAGEQQPEPAGLAEVEAAILAAPLPDLAAFAEDVPADDLWLVEDGRWAGDAVDFAVAVRTEILAALRSLELAATADAVRLRAALEEIVECRSVYSRDPLERAHNAVEHCQGVAREALAAPAPAAGALEGLLERIEECWGDVPRSVQRLTTELRAALGLPEVRP